MFKKKKEKRYKLKNLYVCKICLAHNKKIYYECDAQTLTYISSIQALKVLYSTIFSKVFVDPVTGKRFKLKKGNLKYNYQNEIYCEIISAVDVSCNISDEIYMNRNYLTLDEIVMINRSLKNQFNKL